SQRARAGAPGRGAAARRSGRRGERVPGGVVRAPARLRLGRAPAAAELPRRNRVRVAPETASLAPRLRLERSELGIARVAPVLPREAGADQDVAEVLAAREEDGSERPAVAVSSGDAD